MALNKCSLIYSLREFLFTLIRESMLVFLFFCQCTFINFERDPPHTVLEAVQSWQPQLVISWLSSPGLLSYKSLSCYPSSIIAFVFALTSVLINCVFEIFILRNSGIKCLKRADLCSDVIPNVSSWWWRASSSFWRPSIEKKLVNETKFNMNETSELFLTCGHHFRPFSHLR